jgi:hypothetical protein
MEVLSTSSSLECDAPKPEVKPRHSAVIHLSCHSPFLMLHFVIRSGVVLTAADPNGRNGREHCLFRKTHLEIYGFGSPKEAVD